MNLAACAKDVKFYKWPNICYTGVYETPMDCMSVKTISWSCTGKELLVVKSKGNPVIISPPSKPEEFIEPFDCIHITNASVGTFSNTSPNLLAFGTESGGIHFYNTKTRQKLSQTFKKLPSNIQNLEFSADDQTVAAGCLNGQIFLYDSKFRPYVSFMIPNSPTLSTMAYSKFASNLIAGGSKEGVLALWDTETTDNILCSRNHDNRITDITFYGNILSTVGIDGNFVTYDMRSYTCSFKYELDCPLSSLAYLPNSYEMAISTTSGQLRSYDARNMKNPLRTLVAYSNGGIKKIAFPNVTSDWDDSHITPTTAYQKTFAKSKNNNYEDDFSASGDFSIITDESAKVYPIYQPHKNVVAVPRKCDEDTDNVPSSVEILASPKKVRHSEIEELSKVLEDKVRCSCKEFEEKLFQTFYSLRINTSKQFIGLEEKISQSWNNFVDYLRLSGGGSNTGDMMSREDIEMYQDMDNIED